MRANHSDVGVGHWEFSLRNVQSHKETQWELLTFEMALTMAHNSTLLCASLTQKNTLKQFACVQGKEKKTTKGKKNEVWVEKF